MAIPILAPNCTWFDTTKSTRASITEIEIVDSYSNSSFPSWNADVNKNGDIKCYIDGTKLIIAGNGSGKIYLNTDSTYCFCAKKVNNVRDNFAELTAITGLNLLKVQETGTTNMQAMFYACSKLKTVDVTGLVTSNVNTISSMFRESAFESIIGLNTWDVSNATSLNSMFALCTSLKNVDFSGWNTSKITDMNNAFSACSALENLESIGGWDTRNVTKASTMFQNCSALKFIDFSNWDLSKATDTSHMFDGCLQLTELHLNTFGMENVLDTNHMFADCEALTTLEVSDWDVSKCEIFSATFNDCRALKVIDVSGWKTSSVKTFEQMFESCHSLEKVIGLENFVTTTLNKNVPATVGQLSGKVPVVELNEMFKGCHVITEINLCSFDTKNCGYFDNMFDGCYKLKTVYVSDLWSTTSAVSSQNMFMGCKEIVGEDGTTYNAANDSNIQYARVDNALLNSAEAGYFSHINFKDKDKEVLVDGKALYRTAKAIRNKLGTTDTYKPDAFASAIYSIS